MSKANEGLSRREVMRKGARGLALITLGSLLGKLVGTARADDNVWQIQPQKCIQCGQCETHCVLQQSAVRAVKTQGMCGYCDLCTGYFLPDALERETGAENLLCPTGAIKRTFIEDPYYSYTVAGAECIACAKCVKGCEQFGNASLYLQIQQDICLNCNECSIALECPAEAFSRVAATEPYRLKKVT